jgi:acyl-coenzyme A synthetase/AMP-(fatty) acid ligase
LSEDYPEVTPDQLLGMDSNGSGADFMTSRYARLPWLVRWDALPEAERRTMVYGLLADGLVSATSGSTGAPRRWQRSADQLWLETGLLAKQIAADRPQALLSLIPPLHLYGALVTVLLGARMGLPSWYCPDTATELPHAAAKRWVIGAIPSGLTRMRRETAWLSEREWVTILHSTARLPDSAADVLRILPGCARLLEIFGSTETGAIAFRGFGDTEWTLAEDVDFGASDYVHAEPAETQLMIRSPRLAAEAGYPQTAEWTMVDFIVRTGEDKFRFEGRRVRLVKVNGRRVDLDQVEATLRENIACADLTCVPVTDGVRGEHFDLQIVPDGPIPFAAMEATFRHLGVQPRRIASVAEIQRSAVGKALQQR